MVVDDDAGVVAEAGRAQSGLQRRHVGQGVSSPFAGGAGQDRVDVDEGSARQVALGVQTGTVAGQGVLDVEDDEVLVVDLVQQVGGVDQGGHAGSSGSWARVWIGTS